MKRWFTIGLLALALVICGVWVGNLQTEANTLQRQYFVLNSDYTKLKSDYSYLQNKIEEAKFYFYYIKPKQRYGVDDLRQYLSRWQWEKGAYVANKFDCSQMSAYLERQLENEGYHTIIIVGKTPFSGSSSAYHAWLLVEATPGTYMPVEATTWSIVDWSSPYFKKYFQYDVMLETIQDVLKYSSTEFNWWVIDISK